MGAARCEPRGGQIPMELVSCQPPDDFLLPGVLSFNALMGLSCYQNQTLKHATLDSFNALSGLYLISTDHIVFLLEYMIDGVNSLSGLYLISTQQQKKNIPVKCQVSIPSRAYTSFLPYRIGRRRIICQMCQFPLGLIPHFYVPLQKPRFYAVSRACFCRYLSEYSDNRCFSCMLTFWTYLMRCTYP